MAKPCQNVPKGKHFPSWIAGIPDTELAEAVRCKVRKEIGEENLTFDPMEKPEATDWCGPANKPKSFLSVHIARDGRWYYDKKARLNYVWFAPACYLHDIGYSACEPKHEVDADFFHNLETICEATVPAGEDRMMAKCKRTAKIYGKWGMSRKKATEAYQDKCGETNDPRLANAMLDFLGIDSRARAQELAAQIQSNPYVGRQRLYHDYVLERDPRDK